MQNQNDMLQCLSKELPPVFGRKAVESLMPGIISAKTLANLDSAGKGPEYYKHGRVVMYERSSFLSWLSERIKKVDGCGLLSDN